MNRMYQKVILGFFAFIVVVATPNVAHAYVDPGTGTMLFQLVLAAIAGSLFAFKSFRIKIVSFIKGVFNNRKE